MTIEELQALFDQLCLESTIEQATRELIEMAKRDPRVGMAVIEAYLAAVRDWNQIIAPAHQTALVNFLRNYKAN